LQPDNNNPDREEIGRLERGEYFSFATLKKSGEWVATPVWFASSGGYYYVFSAADVGKVKRLRNFSQCRVAACTGTGKVTGEWLNSTAELLPLADDKATALKALHQKYGWKMKLTDVMSRITGKFDRRAYIRIKHVQ
jgi:PPOX class probable F420-dependent enzyme